MAPEAMNSSTHFSISTHLPYPTNLTNTFPDAVCDFYGIWSSSNRILKVAQFLAKHLNAELPDLERSLSDYMLFTREDCRDYSEDDTLIAGVWLSIRTTSRLRVTIPRWHRDGRLFASDMPERAHSKYSMTLSKPSAHRKPLVSAVVKEKDNLEIMRAKYAVRLVGQPVIEIAAGEIVRFTWGRKDSL